MTAPSRRRSRGGKGGWEPPRRRALRKLEVHARYLKGETQHQIADAIGLSQPGVSKILRRLEDELLRDQGLKRERQRAQQTMHLRSLYAQALAAWEASREDGERRRQRRTSGAATPGGQTLAEVVTEDRHGDPRLLEIARKILADMRALWGLDPPERIAVDARVAGTLADADLDAELVRRIGLVQGLLGADTSTTTPQDPTPPKETTEERTTTDDETD